MCPRPWFVLAASLLAAPAFVLAGDEEQKEPLFTEQVVVSANLTPVDAESAGASVTVIGPDEIEARGKTSVAELLRTVPGVATVVGGGPGRASSVFIRGADNSHTLVLVDGVRVNAAGTGEYDFADLRVEQIERIEVLRGPQSSLYGSEAIGGVIHVITRRGAPGRHVTAAVDAGNDGARRVRASADGAAEAFDWGVSGALERLPGYSIAAAEAGDETLNPYRNGTAAALFGARLPRDGRVELSLRYSDATVHPDGFDYATGLPAAAPDFRQDREATLGSLKVELPVTARWTQTVRAGTSSEELRGQDPGDVWNNYRIESRVASATWQSDLRLAAHDTLSVGYTYERRTGFSEGGYDEQASVRSVFVQNQWAWRDRLHLTAAVRNDDHTVFGDETTYRVTGALGFAGKKGRVHGSFGTGFKAPTFVDLFFPYYGNRDLRPETSTGYDLGVAGELADGAFTADVTWFRNDIDDLIAYDWSSFAARNIARAEVRGFEAAFGFHPARTVDVALNYTLTDSEDPATGLALPRRPKHAASLSVAFHPTGRLSALLSVFAVRDRIDADGTTLDDYERVDASVQYGLSQRLTAYVRVENLFDSAYAELPGYRTPGRLGSAGIAVSF